MSDLEIVDVVDSENDDEEDRAKYTADDRRRMAGNGQAMPDGSFPIADAQDLQSAIRLARTDSQRRHVIKRARALGHADMIPDTWNADGTQNNSATEPEVHIRAVEFVAETGDGRTLEGYAAVFNSPTRINEFGGEFDEVIAQGAFRQSIRSGTPVLMFEHGKHPLYGTMPIGHIDRLKEDARGLFIKATLHDNWLTEPLQDAIRSQAVSGMSFRFSVPTGKDTWDRSGKMPLRTIREAKLYELGPVVFPAYKDTTVALRSLERAVPNVHFVYDLGPDIRPEDIPEVTAREEGTPDEAALEGTSDEAASIPEPVVSHSASTTRDERQALARRIYIAERGIQHG